MCYSEHNGAKHISTQRTTCTVSRLDQVPDELDDEYHDGQTLVSSDRRNFHVQALVLDTPRLVCHEACNAMHT